MLLAAVYPLPRFPPEPGSDNQAIRKMKVGVFFSCKQTCAFKVTFSLSRYSSAGWLTGLGLDSYENVRETFTWRRSVRHICMLGNCNTIVLILCQLRVGEEGKGIFILQPKPSNDGILVLGNKFTVLITIFTGIGLPFLAELCILMQIAGQLNWIRRSFMLRMELF